MTPGLLTTQQRQGTFFTALSLKFAPELRASLTDNEVPVSGRPEPVHSAAARLSG